MTKLLFSLSIILMIGACGGGPTERPANSKTAPKEEPEVNDKGIGEFTNVSLNDPLDPAMITEGKAIYELKCAACHRTTAQRVVGPGFAGVTSKRSPEWIMNMITNVEVMLAEDPAARELLKQCLVRMPNQNLTADDARNVLEWLYDNDAKQEG